MRRGLSHKAGLGRTVVHSAKALLVLPDGAGAYAVGASKQTLRCKTRAARKAGVRWARVDDLDERRRLVELSVERERTHAMAEYRLDGTQNAELLAHRLWLVAYAADGAPLLLSSPRTTASGRAALLPHPARLARGERRANGAGSGAAQS